MNLLSTLSDVNFARSVQTAVLEHTKEVHDIHYIEHGSDNIIALINKQFVFRFPRSEWAAKRIVFETALLQELKGKIRIVPVPEFTQVHTYPLYTVARYISGSHLNTDDIRKMSPEDQRVLGTDIATFAVEVDKAVNRQEIIRLRLEAGVDTLDIQWEKRFKELFEDKELPNAKLHPIVDRFYGPWKQTLSQDANVYTIHESLRPEALLFDCNKLVGIIDFGHITTGSEVYAFRWLYAMGDTVLEAAVDRFVQLTGQYIDIEHIRLWAIMQELAVFSELLAAQDTEGTGFRQARTRLHGWISDFPI